MEWPPLTLGYGLSIVDARLPRSTRRMQVVRVAYIVGNLTVGNSRLRHTVGLRLGGVDLFAALLGRYTWRRQPPPPSSSDAMGPVTKPAAAAETDEAVLVKVVRVLANLAIHPQVYIGPWPSHSPDSPRTCELPKLTRTILLAHERFFQILGL